MTRFWKLYLTRSNWFLTVVVGILLVVSVLFVYGSCYVGEDEPVRPLYLKQLMWAIVGLVGYFIMAVSDYQKLVKWSWWFYGISLLLLVLVLLIGTKIYGARRWLMVFGIGLQPSELAKLSVILVLAWMLNRAGTDFGHVGPVGAVLLAVVVPMGLVMKEPDLGTGIVFVPILFAMMFAAGVPLRTLGAFVATGLVVVGVVLSALFLPGALGANAATQERFMKVVGISEYQRDRIVTFLDPGRDPLGAGWNKMQSEIAVGSGGKWGKGFLKGTQNVLGFLPRSVAPTDFIYSVIAEETGFFGSVVVLSLFGAVIVLGLQTALMAQDKLGRLLCVGVVAFLFTHAFVNIAMTVGILPVTGLPLPLLSYGGTFMVVVMVSLGLVQSVYVRARRG